MHADERVARRYARALGEVAHEREQLHEVAAQFAAVARQVDDNPEFARALSNPNVPPHVKQEVLLAVAEHVADGELNSFVRRFLELLANKRRADQITAINRALTAFADEIFGRANVKVTSAVAIDEAQLAALTEALQKAIHKTPMLDAGVDPSLLGGIVVQVDDVKLDGSIAGRMEKLAGSLRARTM